MKLYIEINVNHVEKFDSGQTVFLLKLFIAENGIEI